MLKKKIIFKDKRNKQAFTLIEVVVAMAIFSIIMLAVTQVFVSIIKSYRVAKRMQRNIENSQYALNFISKTLRTSEIKDSSDPSTLELFDPSQGKCFVFQLKDNHLQWASDDSNSPTQLSECNFGSMFPVNFINSEITGRFLIVSNNSGNTVGKVTINLTTQEGNKSAHFQTTLSLRNH